MRVQNYSQNSIDLVVQKKRIKNILKKNKTMGKIKQNIRISIEQEWLCLKKQQQRTTEKTKTEKQKQIRRKQNM